MSKSKRSDIEIMSVHGSSPIPLEEEQAAIRFGYCIFTKNKHFRGIHE